MWTIMKQLKEVCQEEKTANTKLWYGVGGSKDLVFEIKRKRPIWLECCEWKKEGPGEVGYCVRPWRPYWKFGFYFKCNGKLSKGF